MNPTTSNTCGDITPLFTRRDVLGNLACGFGWLAFAGLAGRNAIAADANPLVPKQPHFPARAKRVIFLCMRGGPSHVDTFDHKPKLTADNDKPGKRPGTKLLGSKWKFAQHGKSGLWISELFPNIAKHADEMALVRSMQTDLPAHPQAFVKMHTGNSQFVRPSLGAWTLYGLGTENQNLPGFITLSPPAGFGGAQNYGSAFLPAIYQATRIGRDNRPVVGAQVRNIQATLGPTAQRAELELIQTLNREALRRDKYNPEIEGVIESYELAFKMQSQMPAVMDIEKESEATKNSTASAAPAVAAAAFSQAAAPAAAARTTWAGSVSSRGNSSRPACATWRSTTATGTSISTSATRSRQTARPWISPSRACSPISSSAGF